MYIKRLIGVSILWSIILIPIFYIDMYYEIRKAKSYEGVFLLMLPFIYGSILGLLTEVVIWFGSKIKGQINLFNLNNLHKEKELLDKLKAEGLIDSSEYQVRLDKIKSKI